MTMVFYEWLCLLLFLLLFFINLSHQQTSLLQLLRLCVHYLENTFIHLHTSMGSLGLLRLV